jgi:hypothetical protein
MTLRAVLIFSGVTCAVVAGIAQQPGPEPPAPPATTPATGAGAGRSTNLGNDPNGNPLRLALKTGHVSNYDEAKVAPYTLPDPLVTTDGKPVRDAKVWTTVRRPEILRAYESEIYGRIPPKTPQVTWQVVETDDKARSGAAIRRRIVGAMGSSADAPRITVTVNSPANAKTPTPVILLVNFGGGPPPPPGTTTRGPGFNAHADPSVADEILSRGWAYATVGYADIQPDRANTYGEGVMALSGTVPPDARVVVGNQPNHRLFRD